MPRPGHPQGGARPSSKSCLPTPRRTLSGARIDWRRREPRRGEEICAGKRENEEERRRKMQTTGSSTTTTGGKTNTATFNCTVWWRVSLLIDPSNETINPQQECYSDHWPVWTSVTACTHAHTHTHTHPHSYPLSSLSLPNTSRTIEEKVEKGARCPPTHDPCPTRRGRVRTALNPPPTPFLTPMIPPALPYPPTHPRPPSLAPGNTHTHTHTYTHTHTPPTSLGGSVLCLICLFIFCKFLFFSSHLCFFSLYYTNFKYIVEDDFLEAVHQHH